MLSRKVMASLLIAAIVPSAGGCGDPVLEQRQRDGLHVAPFAPREYIRIRQQEDEDAVIDQMGGEN